jgi:hypothetical protein
MINLTMLNLFVYLTFEIIYSYAFLVHGRGPAVGDFGFDLSSNRTLTSSNVVIRQNKITNIKCWTNEVPGKKTITKKIRMND